MISGGLKIDGIPPEKTFVVVVMLGRELVVEEHTVSRNKAVTRQGEIPGDVLWWMDGVWSID